MQNASIEALKERIKTAQDSLLNQLRSESQFDEEVEELAHLDVSEDRLDKLFGLYNDSINLVELANDIQQSTGRLKKRFAEKADELYKEIKQETKESGGHLATENWEAKIQNAKGSVVVDCLEDIPKKYRSKPKPLPPEKEWPSNKNLIYQVLSSHEVTKIAGVHVKSGETLKITPRW